MREIFICPFCDRYLFSKDPDIAWVISGMGRFRRKQYFHKKCFYENNKKRTGENAPNSPK